ncbi:MAG: hypothetical protein ACJ8AT_36570 [Hyalangium sp.]|uniref:hypothetical protein n=1 Tax=Hyalangium sp. TaxID=2028555 RepID=UPI00389B1758
MPSFLHGSYAEVSRKTRQEGQRCGEQYRDQGSFPAPRELLEVPAGEVVVAHDVVDFQHERPVWRLHMMANVMSALYETVEPQKTFQARDAYEDVCRATAWGALYFTIAPTGPVSAERTSRRLQALMPFWEPLQSVRYLFKTVNAALTLDELLSTACDWAMEAWSPVGEGSVRTRLELAAERMGRATHEDSIEAILRQMPRALQHAQGVKHRDVLANPEFLRQRLASLSHEAFTHLSAAWTAGLIRQLHVWDRQLGTH